MGSSYSEAQSSLLPWLPRAKQTKKFHIPQNPVTHTTCKLPSSQQQVLITPMVALRKLHDNSTCLLWLLKAQPSQDYFRQSALNIFLSSFSEF